MWDLCVSAPGCLVFTRGFRQIEAGKEGFGTRSSVSVATPSRIPSAGIGAAVFLLAFIACEALAMISTLRR
jgi:hypothetical protein